MRIRFFRMTQATIKRTASASTKSSTNLYLSNDARRHGRALKKALKRGSLTNVVEFLLAEAHAKYCARISSVAGGVESVRASAVAS